jgi:DNA topoisomerase-1
MSAIPEDFMGYLQKADPELADLIEKDRVRTLEGVKRFNLPIGSVIGSTQKPMETAVSPSTAPPRTKVGEQVYKTIDQGLWAKKSRLMLDPKGGASVNYVSGEWPPQIGAMCSRDSSRTRIFTAAQWKRHRRELLSRFIEENEDYFGEEDNIYVGAWVEKDLVWLDPSRRFDSIEEAATYGKEIGELEVFSLTDLKSKPVDDIVKSDNGVHLLIADPHNLHQDSFYEKTLELLEACERMGTIEKAVRRVRTPEGAKRFGQPIGSIILRDGQKAIPWLKANLMGEDEYGIEHFDGMDGNSYGIVEAYNLDDWSELPRGTAESDLVVLWFPNGHSNPSDYEVMGDGQRFSGEYSAISWLNQDIGKQVADKKLQDVRWVPGGYRRPTKKEKTSVKSGGGVTKFDNRNAKGERIPLAIPPAWSNVVVAEDPNADVWVYGMDSLMREQTIRNPAATGKAAAKKYAHAKKVARDHVVSLDGSVSRDWKGSENAAVVMLMLRLGMRIGGEGGETVKDHTALGARTITAGNIRFGNDSATLSFVGKSAQPITLTTKDPEIISMLKHYKGSKTGKARLFPGAGLSGVGRYLKDNTDGMVKPKDLRTVKGTSLALEAISKLGPRSKPKSKADYIKRRNKIADDVAKALGNTRTMALGSYIAPEVWVKLTTPNNTDWLGPKGF